MKHGNQPTTSNKGAKKENEKAEANRRAFLAAGIEPGNFRKPIKVEKSF